MSLLVDQLLVDDVLDAYVAWRERQAAVREAYERWSAALIADAADEFAAYRSALDDEQRAAGRYADLVAKLRSDDPYLPQIRGDKMG